MKLLDEKGLTTVWAAIKNTFTSKSDADKKYAEKSKALGDINFDYTAFGINMSTYTLDGDSYGDITITSATSTTAGVMTASDKTKLDNIAAGANNYTLPVASANTLGGIKTGYSDNNTINWPVKVDDNNNAYVPIYGLTRGSGNTVQNLSLGSSNAGTTYKVGSIEINSRQQGVSCTCYLPQKSGTIALTSDIVDASNLCRFNSAKSIEQCLYDRINLLYLNSNEIYLDSLKTKEGIIIFAYFHSNTEISMQQSIGGFLFNNTKIDRVITDKGMHLITNINGTITVLKF